MVFRRRPSPPTDGTTLDSHITSTSTDHALRLLVDGRTVSEPMDAQYIDYAGQYPARLSIGDAPELQLSFRRRSRALVRFSSRTHSRRRAHVDAPPARWRPRSPPDPASGGVGDRRPRDRRLDHPCLRRLGARAWSSSCDDTGCAHRPVVRMHKQTTTLGRTSSHDRCRRETESPRPERTGSGITSWQTHTRWRACDSTAETSRSASTVSGPQVLRRKPNRRANSSDPSDVP